MVHVMSYIITKKKVSSQTMNGYQIFLDVLRDSGVTNMYGAIPYLMEQFEELDRSQAKYILMTWMEWKTANDDSEFSEFADKKQQEEEYDELIEKINALKEEAKK